MKTTGFLGVVAVLWLTCVSSIETGAVTTSTDHARDVRVDDGERTSSSTSSQGRRTMDTEWHAERPAAGDQLTADDAAARIKRSADDRQRPSTTTGGVDAADHQQQRSARGGLDRNFLRFGRGGLKTNFLRFGRGGLDRNFLRFGRRFEGDNEDEAGNLNQLLEAIKIAMNEDVEADDVAGQPMMTKRGSLNNNFLRYGRRLADHQQLQNRPATSSTALGGKRGSLERNFLRFGKRSGHSANNDHQALSDKRNSPDTMAMMTSIEEDNKRSSR